ncbi:MAG: 50S ribosomal protein L20 [Verrucomicrobia bacterium]|nr:50S ribosomal protein L20 [Verrucomicrobiota bacterium]MCH8527815.1 50S ribosomal protein L20 [Kiritimatiellia bacterium]
MPRATNAPASRKRRHDRLKLARGFRGGRSKLFRTATESVDRAQCMAFAHRKTKKRDFRALWIMRISAAVKPFGLNYSTFMNGVKKAGIDLNRKMLSEIAIHDPEGFAGIVEKAKAQLT